jgi:hypothetical protein
MYSWTVYFFSILALVGSVVEGWWGLYERECGVIGRMGYSLVMGCGEEVVQLVFNNNLKYWIIRFG